MDEVCLDSGAGVEVFIETNHLFRLPPDYSFVTLSNTRLQWNRGLFSVRLVLATRRKRRLRPLACSPSPLLGQPSYHL